MIKRNDQLQLQVAEEGVYLNEGELIPADNISIGSEPHRSYAPFNAPFWIKATIIQCDAGILAIDIVEISAEAPPKAPQQTLAMGSARKLMIKWTQNSNTNFKYKFAGRKTVRDPAFEYDWRRFSPGELPTTNSEPIRTATQLSHTVTPAPGTRLQHSVPKRKMRPRAAPLPFTKTPPPCTSPRPKTELPIREHRETYHFCFEEMEIVEGAALFHADLRLKNRSPLPITLRIENSALTAALDCIKPYISKRLNRVRLTVSATIQTRGIDVVSTHAECALVDQINDDFIGSLRHWHVTRELREAKNKNQLISSNSLTDDDLFERANLKPAGDPLVDDVLSIKNQQHADHIHYLSSRHLHSKMDLRWESGMDAFLFLLSGKNSCFLVLETLDSQKATYLWTLHATESELSNNPDLFHQKFEQVEQEISIIRTEGRMVYKQKSSDEFSRVHHDYLKPDGLEIWKDRLSAILDGESA